VGQTFCRYRLRFMPFHKNMGPRQSMVYELLDTLYFGNLDRHNPAGSYRKVKTATGDAYMVPFAQSKKCFGAIMIHSPRRIEVFYSMMGKQIKTKCFGLYDTKLFMIKTFIDT